MKVNNYSWNIAWLKASQKTSFAEKTACYRIISHVLFEHKKTYCV